jgi:tRNA(fMet)-specific endonuclease VapC
MIKYLLDTNVVIYVLKRRPIRVLEIFNKNTNRMAISSITLSELIYGAEKSIKIDKNLEAIEDFISHL